MTTKQFTQENLEFLRTGAGISSEQLAAIANIDIAKMYQYQTEDMPSKIEAIDAMIRICNHFMIKLEVLVYTQLGPSPSFDAVFTAIKEELSGGQPVDREEFKNSFRDGLYTNDDESEETDPTDLSVLMHTTRLLHEMFIHQEYYDEMRSKGLIDKIEFIEKHEPVAA